jgi:hypothetical protein
LLERSDGSGTAASWAPRDGVQRQRPLLAVDPAGCLPYFSKLPSVDMLGINDHYLARHRPADFGTGYIGHELGNGAYVLSRKPDLVLFNVPTGGKKPNFRSGIEMMEDPRAEFTSTFARLRSSVSVRSGLAHLDADRGRGGIHGPDRIRIPEYLFS